MSRAACLFPLTGLLLSPETRLDNAWAALRRAGVDEAPVFDGHRLCGALSLEEITAFRGRCRAPREARVDEALTRRFDYGYDLGYQPPLLVELPR